MNKKIEPSHSQIKKELQTVDIRVCQVSHGGVWKAKSQGTKIIKQTKNYQVPPSQVNDANLISDVRWKKNNPDCKAHAQNERGTLNFFEKRW